MTTITKLPKDGQQVEFRLSKDAPWLSGIYHKIIDCFIISGLHRPCNGQKVYDWRPRKEGEDA